MEDRIHPMLGIGRELSIQFALAYDPMSSPPQAIADGKIDLSPWPTGTVGVEGAAGLRRPRRPRAPRQILVVPTFYVKPVER